MHLLSIFAIHSCTLDCRYTTAAPLDLLEQIVGPGVVGVVLVGIVVGRVVRVVDDVVVSLVSIVVVGVLVLGPVVVVVGVVLVALLVEWVWEDCMAVWGVMGCGLAGLRSAWVGLD